jgi:hypothetical protein
MNLVSISKLYDDIRLEVPGAPNPLIQDRVRWAATEFCKRTLISNESIDCIDIDAGEPLVQIDPPNACVNIWRIMWLKGPNGFLPVADRQQMSSVGNDWDQGEAEWPTMYIPHRQNNIIQLVPKPDTSHSDALIAHCAFIPHPETSKIDSVLYQFYREGIVRGAIAKLLGMAGAGWYNPTAAATAEYEFQVEISRAKANQGKDNSLADMTVSMSPFV